MQVQDRTVYVAPPPPPPPPAYPLPPWRGETIQTGGIRGTATIPRLAKIRDGNRTYYELIEEGGDEDRMWKYVLWLEQENARLTAANARLTLAAETLPLLAPTVPPAFAAPVDAPVPVVSPEPRADVPFVGHDGNMAFPAVPDFPEPAVAAQTTANETAPPTTVFAEETADKRSRAVAALIANPGASNPQLAEVAGCSDEYIRRIRHQLMSEGKLPPAVKGTNISTNPESARETAVGGAELVGVGAE